MFRRKPNELVGLDIGSSAIRLVELKKKSADYELVSVAIEDLARDTVVDGAVMDTDAATSVIEKIFAGQKTKGRNVAMAVSGHSVIVKRISVPAGTGEELQNVLAYEAQQHVPFDLAEVSLSYHVLGTNEASNAMDVVLVAAKRDKIMNRASVASQAGATPVVMDIDAFALQNAYELNYQPGPDHTSALLNIGASMMNINIVRGGVPLFTRDVTVGGDQYTHTLQKELDLSFEDAEKLKLGKGSSPEQLEARVQHLHAVSEIVLLEIHKTFDFFHQTAPAETIHDIYIAGGTARTEGLKELLGAQFNVPVEIMNPFRKVAVNPGRFDSAFISEIAPRMSVAVGLALRSFDLA
jgi:type IV pilus assembly protein PilM